MVGGDRSVGPMPGTGLSGGLSGIGRAMSSPTGVDEWIFGECASQRDAQRFRLGTHRCGQRQKTVAHADDQAAHPVGWMISRVQGADPGRWCSARPSSRGVKVAAPSRQVVVDLSGIPNCAAGWSRSRSFRHLRRRDGRLQGLGERPVSLRRSHAVMVAQQTLDK